MGFVDMNFNEEMESSEMDKALIRRKRVRVNRHKPAGSERSHARSHLNHFMVLM